MIFSNAKEKKQKLKLEIQARENFHQDLSFMILSMHKDAAIKRIFRKHSEILEKLKKKSGSMEGVRTMLSGQISSVDEVVTGKSELSEFLDYIESGVMKETDRLLQLKILRNTVAFSRISRMKRLLNLINKQKFKDYEDFQNYVRELKRKAESVSQQTQDNAETKIEDRVVDVDAPSARFERVSREQDEKYKRINKETNQLENSIRQTDPEMVKQLHLSDLQQEITDIQQLEDDLSATIKEREADFQKSDQEKGKSKKSQVSSGDLDSIQIEWTDKPKPLYHPKKSNDKKSNKEDKKKEEERKAAEEQQMHSALLNQDDDDLKQILEKHQEFVRFMNAHSAWLTGAEFGAEWHIQKDNKYTLDSVSKSYSETYLNVNRIKLLYELMRRLEARKQLQLTKMLPSDYSIALFDKILEDLNRALHRRLKPILKRINEIDPSADTRFFHRLFKKIVLDKAKGIIAFKASPIHTVESLLALTVQGRSGFDHKEFFEQILIQYVSSTDTQEPMASQKPAKGIQLKALARAQLKSFLLGKPELNSFLYSNLKKLDPIHQHYLWHLESQRSKDQTKRKSKQPVLPLLFFSGASNSENGVLETKIHETQSAPHPLPELQIVESKTELGSPLIAVSTLGVKKIVANNIEPKIESLRMKLQDLRKNEEVNRKAIFNIERQLKEYNFILNNYLIDVRNWALNKNYWTDADDKVISEFGKVDVKEIGVTIIKFDELTLLNRSQLLKHVNKKFQEYRRREELEEIIAVEDKFKEAEGDLRAAIIALDVNGLSKTEKKELESDFKGAKENYNHVLLEYNNMRLKWLEAIGRLKNYDPDSLERTEKEQDRIDIDFWREYNNEGAIKSRLDLIFKNMPGVIQEMEKIRKQGQQGQAQVPKRTSKPS